MDCVTSAFSAGYGWHFLCKKVLMWTVGPYVVGAVTTTQPKTNTTMETIIKINSLADIREIAQAEFARQSKAIVGLNYFIEIAGTIIHVTVNRALDVVPVTL